MPVDALLSEVCMHRADVSGPAQEYNICFTTVRRPDDGGIAPLPEPSHDMAILPKARILSV